MNLDDQNIFTIIGLITIKFSRLEYLTLEYLSILDCGYVSVENNMIFQDFTLDKKIQTLKKLIKLKYNGHFEQIQLELIQRIDGLREIRNLFIHGSWNIQELKDLDKISSLSVKQFKYKLDQPNNGIIDKIWKTGDARQFTKSDLIDFHSRVETATKNLLQIMTENERILGSRTN